jgi:hypothetical protein
LFLKTLDLQIVGDYALYNKAIPPPKLLGEMVECRSLFRPSVAYPQGTVRLRNAARNVVDDFSKLPDCSAQTSAAEFADATMI